jgi:hypothetical protein
MSNSNWQRWIFASTSKYFQGIADAYPVIMHIEGVERLSSDESKWIEFRIDGPLTTEYSHNFFQLEVVINILWSVHMSSQDFHETQKLSGALVTAMTNICVYKYGDGLEDDSTLLGVLTLRQDKYSPVRANNFGQVRADTHLVQGTVEASYRMFLSE